VICNSLQKVHHGSYLWCIFYFMIDIKGNVFGKLTVVGFSHINESKRVAIWDCICECGKSHKASGVNLRNGQVRSCGCLRIETLSSMVPYNFDDLTGRTFGYLNVIGEGEKQKQHTVWVCKCECGNITEVIASNLKKGRQVSCGCFNKKKSKDRLTTHGLSKTRIYKIWVGMISRCYNPKRSHYADYGGRGIIMSDEWRNDFMVFYNDMIGSYDKNLQLDRIDVNGNYCKENCRWVTVLVNARNKRNTIYLTIDNITKPASEWAELKNVNYHKMHERIMQGKEGKEALYGRIRVPVERMMLPKK